MKIKYRITVEDFVAAKKVDPRLANAFLHAKLLQSKGSDALVLPRNAIIEGDYNKFVTELENRCDNNS